MIPERGEKPPVAVAHRRGPLDPVQEALGRRAEAGERGDPVIASNGTLERLAFVDGAGVHPAVGNEAAVDRHELCEFDANVAVVRGERPPEVEAVGLDPDARGDRHSRSLAPGPFLGRLVEGFFLPIQPGGEQPPRDDQQAATDVVDPDGGFLLGTVRTDRTQQQRGAIDE